MPETLDDLFASVSADVAARTSAPGAREAIASTRRRTAGYAVAATVAMLVAVATVGLLSGPPSGDRPDPASTTSPPTQRLGVGKDAVWHDDAGLHHGSDVLQTAVRLRTGGGPSGLTRVRTGVLYIDAVGEDVWFQPWNGEPRAIGHDSKYGAVGDPDGFTAAWFEGDRNAWVTDAELVLYDTARLREVARVRTTPPDPEGGEHLKDGPGILWVSGETVVWQTRRDGVLRFDVGSDRPVAVGGSATSSKAGSSVIDVDAGTELLSLGALGGDEGLTLRRPGVKQRSLDGVEARGRLSPDGRYLLAITSNPHGSRFFDVRTGESFTLPPQEGPHYAWLGWSQGSTALIHITREGDRPVSKLFACDAGRRRCERLPSVGDEVLVPAT